MKAIKQTVTLDANPHEVYEMLMDSKKHSEMIGAGARISRKVGGKFSVWDGDISGVNISLVKDKKIVQKWRSSDWPKGVYSKATFELKKIGNKTKLVLTQTGVPKDKYEDIKQGWTDYYWNRMKSKLSGRLSL